MPPSASNAIVSVGQVLACVCWLSYFTVRVRLEREFACETMIWCILLAGSYLLVSFEKGKAIRTRIFIGAALLFMVPEALRNIGIRPGWLPKLPYGYLAFWIPALLGISLWVHWRRKWLYDRLAWRFSLARLMIAIVFLGALIGLNMRRVPCGAENFYGWPLPFMKKRETGKRMRPIVCRFPATHYWTYRLADRSPFRWTSHANWFVSCGIINALVLLVPLTVILFFHPRRKPPDKAPV